MQSQAALVVVNELQAWTSTILAGMFQGRVTAWSWRPEPLSLSVIPSDRCESRNTLFVVLLPHHPFCCAANEDSQPSDDPLGSGTEDSEAEDGDEEDEGGSDLEAEAQILKESLQARQAARAAGDHPLQQNLRDQAAELLAKYGLAPTQKKQTAKSAAGMCTTCSSSSG